MTGAWLASECDLECSQARCLAEPDCKGVWNSTSITFLLREIVSSTNEEFSCFERTIPTIPIEPISMTLSFDGLTDEEIEAATLSMRETLAEQLGVPVESIILVDGGWRRKRRALQESSATFQISLEDESERSDFTEALESSTLLNGISNTIQEETGKTASVTSTVQPPGSMNPIIQ